MFALNRYFQHVSDDTVIWRYMPYERLLSILETESIFFAKVTTYEDDLFEGSYNKASTDHYTQWLQANEAELTETSTADDQRIENSLWLAEKMKNLVLVNCWHMNDYESVAMWKLYSNYENGVAIRTTFGRLKKSLEGYSKLIHGGAVQYIDIKQHRISFTNTLAPYTFKRLSFAYERELRLTTQVEPEKGFDYDWSTEEFINGKLIPCDIKLLFHAVFVSPKYSEEFKSQVQDALVRKGINIEVEKSDLNNIY